MLSSNSNSSFYCSADLDVLHEAVALATAGQGLSSGSNGGKGDLHQLIHACKTQQIDTVHGKHRTEPNQVINNISLYYLALQLCYHFL